MLKRWKISVGILSLVVASCGPRDVKVEEEGSAPVVLTNAGDRSPTCPADFTDDMALRSPTESDTKVFAGKITASLNVGDRNCFRVGSVVNLQNGKSGTVRGQVTVTKIEIFPVGMIAASHAQALGMEQGALKALANEEIEKAKATFPPKGMVNITHFKYNQGSAIVSTFVLDKEGERGPTCPADFKDSTRVIVPADFTDKIVAKKITAAMEAGDRNCFRIGTEAGIHVNKDAPAIAKVKVVKVQVIHKDNLDKTHAQALGIDEKNLKAAAEEKIAAVKFDAMGLVHITYFQIDSTDVVINPPEDDIPVIDVEMYKKMIPQLKEQLAPKLSAVFEKYAVAWDASTIEVEYNSTVTLKNPVAEDGLYPAFRVTLKTAKGNTLAVYNLIDGKKRVLVMNTSIDNNDVVDVEGSIISAQSTWSSVSAIFVPSGTTLYNETTDKPATMNLGVDFDPLIIDVTPK